MFEVIPGELSRLRTLPPAVDLVRRVGLADARGDYLRTEEFVCELRYEHDAEAVAAVTVRAVQMSFAPGRGASEVDAFVARVRGESAFGALIENCRASGIVMTEPRERSTLAAGAPPGAGSWSPRAGSEARKGTDAERRRSAVGGRRRFVRA